MSMKRKLEEQRKKEEEERLAAVHKDFLDSFSDAPKLDKAWVKAGTAETERRGDNVKREIYKPKSKLAELAGSFKSHHSQSRDEHSSPKPSLKKPQRESKKSNLEIFKEELKAMQEERDERRKLRTHIKDCEDQGIAPTLLTSSGKPSRFEADHSTIRSIEKSLETDIYGSMSSGSKSSAYENDHTTTNVYCGNIAPKMSEQDLCEVFGKYGPLASIKIMYPRSEEERAKNRHTGFVGFMKRSDAEDAFDGLKGETIMGYEMRLSWGKPIPIPPRPIYIPPSMIKETQPPPPSGLPFNAQPLPDWHPDIDRFGNQDVTKNLDSTEVKIVIPTDRLLLCLIHRMVEYVIREGPLFEAMIMNKEMNNPRFRFLFDNQTPAHTYYRWKLYSILQGDEPHVWNTKPFQMFVGGSYWLPPKMNPYMQKQVTKETSKQSTAVTSSDRKRTALSDRQRERLGDILRELTADRVKVGEAMIWCLEHAEASQEIVEILKDALTIGDTAQQKKLARLYVVSDVLYNSSAKLPYVSNFRKFFEPMLPDVFKSFNDTYMSIEGRMQAEHFKQKIMSCFRTWDEWVIYPPDHLIKCQNIFLGLMEPGEAEEVEEDVDGAPLSPAADADIDGEPLNDTTNIDGEPLRAKSNGRRRVQEDDIDGIPVDDDDDIDGAPLNKSNNSTASAKLSALDSKPKFAASKWETVDEEVVKAQAMTTSKWEQLEEPAAGDQGSYRRSYDHSPASDDLDGQPIDSRGSSPMDDNDLSKGGMSGLASLSAAYTPNEKRAKLEMTEKRRTKLRDIEMKVVKYQDELEAGRRSRKPRMSIGQQVEAYRQKLLNKEREEAMREQSDESPYRSDSRSERKKRYADKSRSPSPRGGRRTSRRSRSRSSSRSHSIRASRRSRSPRSRSPRRSKRSRSRSSDRYNRHKKNRH